MRGEEVFLSLSLSISLTLSYFNCTGNVTFIKESSVNTDCKDLVRPGCVKFDYGNRFLTAYETICVQIPITDYAKFSPFSGFVYYDEFGCRALLFRPDGSCVDTNSPSSFRYNPETRKFMQYSHSGCSQETSPTFANNPGVCQSTSTEIKKFHVSSQ